MVLIEQMVCAVVVGEAVGVVHPADVRAEMNDAIAVVAQDKGVSIVFDLDNGSVPYILSGLAVDLTADVIQLLGIEEEPR
jgi:hypothetical protein